ncbi:MAG TPA: hypothetical protein VGU71_01650, partial [Candidatus Dormibacteraeota bacterium]|nr:hypothetical protein [Candidatus Dormibacteraeota bacterium]
MGMMQGGGPSMIHWLRGRRQNPDTGQANSGLTGDPSLEQPPMPEGPKDFRGRWASLKQSVTGTASALPRVLRLVWDASPATTLALFVATAIAGVMPAAAAWTAKLLIDAVVQGIAVHNFHQPDRVWPLCAPPSGACALGPWELPAYTAIGAIVFLAILQLVLFAFTAL